MEITPDHLILQLISLCLPDLKGWRRWNKSRSILYNEPIPDLPDLLDFDPRIIDYKEARGTSNQILDCQWVIMNTTGKHGKLPSHKPRPATLGNQQYDCDLPTPATALAMTLLGDGRKIRP